MRLVIPLSQPFLNAGSPTVGFEPTTGVSQRWSRMGSGAVWRRCGAARRLLRALQSPRCGHRPPPQRPTCRLWSSSSSPSPMWSASEFAHGPGGGESMEQQDDYEEPHARHDEASQLLNRCIRREDPLRLSTVQ